jgi:C4-dicarboxylate-specific signal transduction histidine kinase
MVLDYKDEGCEIATEKLKNIYDPLYSSKKDDVGLGLSTVYKTVNENSFLNLFNSLRGLIMVISLSRCATSLQKTLLLLNTPQEILQGSYEKSRN